MHHTYEPLIAAFNQQHPGITVQFVALDGVYQRGANDSAIMREIVSRADTAEAPASAEQFQQGLLHDLGPLIDADADFDREDFYPGALSGSTASGGAIYKLPQSLEVPLLFYNQDLWDARGVAAPKPDWSLQDLTAAARQLARKQGDTISVYGLADDNTYLAMLLNELRGAGVDLLVTRPEEAHVDRPEVAAVLDRMADLFTSGAFFFPPQGQDWREQVDQLIADQKLAIWGSSASRGGYVAKGQPARFRIGVAPSPAFSLGSVGFADGWIMSSGTAHPDEAWAWLSFLSKQSIATQDSPKGAPDRSNILPARKSLAEQSGYWSRLDEQTKAAVLAMLDRPVTAAPNESVLEAYQPLIQAIQDIMGGQSASAAASKAQQQIAAQAMQAHETPALTPSIEPVVVATPVPNVAAPDATTITFGMPLGKGGDRAMRFVEQFNQANPAIFVQLKDTFTGNGLMSAAQAAAETDCFTAPLPPAPDELTATLDLQPLIDADATFPRDDYPAALLAPYQQNGHLYGLPWGMFVRMLVYNQDLFEAAGLAVPQSAWTIDDLLHAAQQLTSGSGETKQYGFVIPRSQSQAGKFLVHLFGAALTQGSGETLRPNYTSPKVVEASRQVVDLLKHSSPHTRLNDYAQAGPQTDYGELTGQGRVAMWFAWGLYAYGQEQPRFTMAMAAPPLAQGVLDTDDVSTTSLYISANTDKQQACWALLRALSGTMLDGIGGFPARRSVAQSEAFNQGMAGAAALYQAYTEALGRNGQLAPGDNGPGTRTIDYFWFYRAIDRALQGKDLERELAEAQALTEQYIACVRSGDERQDCEQQVDPSYGQG
jgi:ABC-type glycerol-3-phosphate transport system substrate-binding protein